MGPEVDRLQISEALSWRPKWHWVSSGSLIGKAKYISRLILEGERERERERKRGMREDMERPLASIHGGEAQTRRGAISSSSGLPW